MSQVVLAGTLLNSKNLDKHWEQKIYSRTDTVTDGKQARSIHAALLERIMLSMIYTKIQLSRQKAKKPTPSRKLHFI